MSFLEGSLERWAPLNITRGRRFVNETDHPYTLLTSFIERASQDQLPTELDVATFFSHSNAFIGVKEGRFSPAQIDKAINALQRMSAKGNISHFDQSMRVLRVPLSPNSIPKDDADYEHLFSAGSLFADFLEASYDHEITARYAKKLRGREFVGPEYMVQFGLDDLNVPSLLMDPLRTSQFNLLCLATQIEERLPHLPKMLPVWDVTLPALSEESRAHAVRVLSSYAAKPTSLSDEMETRIVAEGRFIIRQLFSFDTLSKSAGHGRPHILVSPAYPLEAISDTINGAEWVGYGAADEYLSDLRRIPMYRF